MTSWGPGFRGAVGGSSSSVSSTPSETSGSNSSGNSGTQGGSFDNSGGERRRSIFYDASGEEVSALHEKDDTDQTPFGHHHTLGKGPYQASPGNHNHNGINSSLIGIENLPDFPRSKITDYPGNQHKYLESYSDFFGGINGVIILDSPMAAFVNGAGAAITSTVPLDNAHHGLLNCVTGSTAAGRAGMFTVPGLMLLGNGEAVVEWIVQFGFLSTAAEEYVFRCGFTDNSAGDTNDGVYFEYDRATSGNVWRVKTANGGVRTTTVTAKAIAAGTWYRLKCTVNAAGTSASFEVDDVSISSPITTNIPTAVGRETALGANIIKTVGVNSRNFIADAYYFAQTLTTPK